MTVTAATPGRMNAQQVLDMAMARVNAGRADEALPLADAVLRQLPEHPPALYLRGVCRLQLGMVEPALGDLDRALALHPGWLEVEFARASALRRLGRTDEALALYERLETRPGIPASLFNNKGNCLLDLGRTDAALAAFDTALARDPTDESAAANRASTLVRLGRGAEGLGILQALLKTNPKRAVARLQLVVSLLALGRVADAEAMAAAGATAHRPWPDGWVRVAQHHLAAGAAGAAEAACRAAIAAAPEQISPRRLYAVLLDQWGRGGDAEIQCRAGLGIAPDDATLRALLARLTM